MRAWQVLGLALMLVAASASHAQEAVPPARTEGSAMDFTHCWGGKKSCTHTDCRAGNAQDVAWYARPGESAAFVGYQVGGGSAFRGSCPGNEEGTWGWDYYGHLLPRRVILSWTHGRRYQGGGGDYRTDGGPHVPDLPSLLNPALRQHNSGH